jgi:hypothetical protein
MNKKKIRRSFNEACLSRDNHTCVTCGNKGDLDVHHITNREEMPDGGYVVENGISLCPDCHKKAEDVYFYRDIDCGFTPSHLYALIGSSYVKAVNASGKNK